MAIHIFYPYKTAENLISLNLDVPGQDVPTDVEGNLKLFALDEVVASVRATALVPDDVIQTVLPKNEQKSPPVRLWLIVKSVTSRKREAIELKGDGTIYEGNIKLRLPDWAGTAEVAAVLARSAVKAKVLSGYAADRGAVLAWSEPKLLYFEAPALPPGAFLEIKWQNFKEGDEWFRARQDHLFALKVSDSAPVIYLNEAIANARPVLDSQGTHGVKGRIRDASYFMIVHQAWSSLIASALSHLARMYADQSYDDRLNGLPQWEAIVLEDWGPYLYPATDKGSAIDQIIEAVQNQIALDELVTERLPTAIQTRFLTTRGFEGLVAEVLTNEI